MGHIFIRVTANAETEQLKKFSFFTFHLVKCQLNSTVISYMNMFRLMDMIIF